MPELSERSLIRVPFARSEETRHSRRYLWQGAHRGPQPFVIVQWTISGEGEVTWEGKKMAVPRNHAFVTVLPEKLTYGYPENGTAPWTFCWVNFYGELGVRLAREFRNHFGPVCPLRAGGSAGLAFRQLVNVAEQREARDPLELSGMAYAFWMKWWRELGQAPGSPEDVLQSVLAHCREHYQDPITVKELAARVSLSREHLTRIFHAHVGVPPADFLRRQRIEAVARLLDDTSWSVEEISMRCGFRSARQCRDAFQARFQCLPVAYRRVRRLTFKAEAEG